MAHPILLYDGVCGLCNRLVQFILRRDRAAIFRFAALQSPFARRILGRHSVNPSDLETVYVVTHDEASELLLPRSEAVVFVLKRLGGIWYVAGTLFQLLPRSLRNWVYRKVARNRYRLFGRFDGCPVPDPAQRSLFLDQ